MRNIKTLLVAATAALAMFLAGCMDSKPDPEKFVKEFSDAIFSGKPEVALEMVDMSNIKEENRDAVTGKLIMLILAVPDEAKKRGGFKNIEIVTLTGDCQEKVGGQCYVKFNEHYNDGSVDESDLRIVNVDGTLKAILQ